MVYKGGRGTQNHRYTTIDIDSIGLSPEFNRLPRRSLYSLLAMTFQTSLRGNVFNVDEVICRSLGTMIEQIASPSQ